MKITILHTHPHPKGVIHVIQASDKILDILFLFHAIERMRRWNLSEQRVVETLLLPEEVTIGHRERYIAHKRYGDHLVRAIYEYEGKLPVVVTVYFPQEDRYFQGGGTYENKILK